MINGILFRTPRRVPVAGPAGVLGELASPLVRRRHVGAVLAALRAACD